MAYVRYRNPWVNQVSVFDAAAGDHIEAGIQAAAATADQALSAAGGSGATGNLSANDLDIYAGADDNAKIGAAFTQLAAMARVKGLQLPARDITVSTARNMYHGMKIYGASGSGVKNLEISGNKLVPYKVTVNSGVGTASWLNCAADVNSVYIGDTAFQANTSAQFMDITAGTLYPATLHSLDFLGFSGVIGSATRKALITQLVCSGHWSMHGFSNTPIHVGGSDNDLWTSGYLNLQNPSSIAGANRYLFWADTLQKTNVANIYATATTGWRPFRVSGSLASGSGLHFTGCRAEGAQATGTAPGPNTGPGVLLEGGGSIWRDLWTAYCMTAPSAGETGVIQVTGGDHQVHGVHWNPGSTTAPTTSSPYGYTGTYPASSVPLVYVSGGKCTVTGARMTSGVKPFGVQTSAAVTANGGSAALVSPDSSINILTV